MRGRLPKYIACILGCGLLVIGGILLANADLGGRSDPPPAAKARIRLM
jgi:hypothetical protein